MENKHMHHRGKRGASFRLKLLQFFTRSRLALKPVEPDEPDDIAEEMAEEERRWKKAMDDAEEYYAFQAGQRAERKYAKYERSAYDAMERAGNSKRYGDGFSGTDHPDEFGGLKPFSDGKREE